jgi:hypothetical protein
LIVWKYYSVNKKDDDFNSHLLKYFYSYCTPVSGLMGLTFDVLNQFYMCFQGRVSFFFKVEALRRKVLNAWSMKTRNAVWTNSILEKKYHPEFHDKTSIWNVLFKDIMYFQPGNCCYPHFMKKETESRRFTALAIGYFPRDHENGT